MTTRVLTCTTTNIGGSKHKTCATRRIVSLTTRVCYLKSLPHCNELLGTIKLPLPRVPTRHRTKGSLILAKRAVQRVESVRWLTYSRPPPNSLTKSLRATWSVVSVKKDPVHVKSIIITIKRCVSTRNRPLYEKPAHMSAAIAAVT